MLNRHTLLLALNDVEDADLERTRRSLKYHIRETGRRTGRVWRTILIAAIIAALMLGTAYAMGLVGLGNMRAGEFLGMKVLSMEGLSDSPEGMALREWLAYYGEHMNDPFDAEEAFALSDEYGAYGVTTKAMAEKVDELCEKYGLKKLGKLVTPQDEKSFYKTAGVGKLTKGSEHYENDYLGGYVYPDGTFQFDGSLFPADEIIVIPYQFRNAGKGSFGYVVSNAGDPNDYTEWTYKTADGHTLTISDSAGGAFLLMDRKESFVTVAISKRGIADSFNDGIIDGVGDTFVNFELSHEQLEQIAETFNWKAGWSYLRVPVSAVYEQQIAPYIRDFELVDFSLEQSGATMGWISFKGTPKKALDWRRIPTKDGELFCRSVLVTKDEQGLPVVGESFDMLPIDKLGNSINLGTEENPDWIWTKNQRKPIASATLHVQQTGKDYTISDQEDLEILTLMLRADEVSSFDRDDPRVNPLYLTFTDGSRGLAFTAASGANAVWINGDWQGYQYGETIFELFGVPLEAKGYTRHDGVLTSRLEEGPDSMLQWVEYDWEEGGNPLERRVMSDQMRPARYEYDKDNNRVRETWWEGDTMTRETVSTYDKDGKILTSRTQNGGSGWMTAEYHYDAQGRLTEEIHRDSDDLPGAIGGNVYYEYDAAGNCRRTLGWQLAEKQ